MRNIIAAFVATLCIYHNASIACNTEAYVGHMMEEIMETYTLNDGAKKRIDAYVDLFAKNIDLSWSFNVALKSNLEKFMLDESEMDLLKKQYTSFVLYSLSKNLTALPLKNGKIVIRDINNIDDDQFNVRIVCSFPNGRKDIGIVLTIGSVNQACKIINLAIDEYDLTYTYRDQFNKFLQNHSVAQLSDKLALKTK